MNSLAQSIITFLFPPQCFVCKRSNNIICDTCLHSISPPLDTPHHFISSRYSYKNEKVKKIIHAIKFFHRKDLLIPLSQELAELLPQKKEGYVLVPIPMPYLRSLFRGYNQSEILAKRLGTLSKIPIDCSLLKRKSSPSRQVTTHNKKERRDNQKGTFIATRSAKGKEIILIDDVTTTGSTLLEARKVLLDAGASSITAITIAH